MPEATYLAPAKINLFLHITSKRADGYHNLQTIFQLLDYGDEITFSLRNDGEIKRIYGNETISPDKDLILRSAHALKKYSRKNKKKIRLVHVSTDEVYGDIEIGKKSKETSSYNPSSPYSATKASADLLIKSFVRTYKLPIIISNCCNNYGPNQFPEKLIPKLIYNIINNKPLPIYGKGKNSREWIHVIDHCEALLKIFFNGKIGESYNVGSNQNINNVNLTKKLLKIVKNKSLKINKKVKIMFVKDRPGHDFRYALNSNKILKKLRWKTKISLHDGLSQTLDWYINNKSFFNSVSKKLHINRLGLKT